MDKTIVPRHYIFKLTQRELYELQRYLDSCDETDIQTPEIVEEMNQTFAEALVEGK